jgi:hypothetical protein
MVVDGRVIITEKRKSDAINVIWLTHINDVRNWAEENAERFGFRYFAPSASTSDLLVVPLKKTPEAYRDLLLRLKRAKLAASYAYYGGAANDRLISPDETPASPQTRQAVRPQAPAASPAPTPARAEPPAPARNYVLKSKPGMGHVFMPETTTSGMAGGYEVPFGARPAGRPYGANKKKRRKKKNRVEALVDSLLAREDQ